MTEREQKVREEQFYPGYILLDEEKRRWRLCHARALEVSESIGGDAGTVAMLTRSYYRSDVPTGDGDADIDGNDIPTEGAATPGDSEAVT